jgi:hypothetical protein
MLWPLLESLTAAIPRMPRELFTGAAVTEILSLARAVRGSVDVFGFECRLAEDSDRVDLGVRLRPPETNDGDPGKPSRRCDRAAERWVRAFVRAPVRFPRLVSCVYLEYDASPSRRAAIPSVFLPLNGGRLDARSRSMPPQLAEVKKLLLDLMGQDRFALCKRALARCFATLPPQGRVLVVGAMLGRSPQTAHLSVSLPRSRARSYLGLLGSSVWSRDVTDVVESLDPDAESVLLDFDVGASIGPRVGVHFATGERRRARHLCTRLAGLGLCAPTKKDALLAWPGADAVRLWKRGWPCRFERYLDHVKITCTADRVTEAKAYLGIAPSFSLLGYGDATTMRTN